MIRTCSLILVVLAFAVTGADAGLFDRGVEGNGDMVTRTFDLDDCHAVRLECGLDIDISFGDEQRVALTMDQNLVRHYELEERDGVLVVAAEDDPRPSREAGLALVLRSLDDVEIEGAGDITIDGVDGDELAITIEGAGDIEATGEVTTLDLVINGAGDVDARDLEAAHVTVRINGAGDARVHAGKSCDVTINGVGDVDVYGQPDEFEKSVHGIGDVERK